MTPRFLFRKEHIVALELDGRLILASERAKGFNTIPAVEAVVLLSQLHDVFLCWQGHLLANPKWSGEGCWLQVQRRDEVSMALHRAATFVYAEENTAYDQLRPSKNAVGVNARLRSCNLMPWDFPLNTLADQILASRSAFPQIAGMISHPVYGETRERWLAPEWPNGRVPVGTSLRSPLNLLFSAFGLPEVDHCMLYTYILGCLHAASLENPRPILVVDSQKQSRGKGEIGQVLSVLLDNQQSALPGVPRGLTKKLVAHLIKGRRVVAAQNLQDVADWNNEFFACISTDGNVEDRALYDRTSTAFSGIVAMISTVYGDASFHEDMISRAWRVYLGGEPCALHPRPREFVVASRDDLLREARDLHERAAATPYEEPPVSRFAEFEAAGAGAYSVLAGKSHAEVRELLKVGYEGARGLRTRAVCEAWKRWPDEFNSSPPAKILSRGQKHSGQSLDGARVFGRSLTE